ncbi:MAG TPA: class I SAM-dependent methyltransferase [Mycobacteriales bacterium]|nr:class I SAM-dependent methyltransferase [Mycobacteriales bacterium]
MSASGHPRQSRWAAGKAGDHGEAYAARFAALAAAGQDMHGEATLCATLVPPGSRILDAGCGTGRVAIRLAELGYDCIGVDSDVSMLSVAQRASTDVEWRHLDLVDVGTLDSDFDLVVAAGNVIPLLAEGTEAAVVTGLSGRLAPDGLMVAGFGLDAAHLPLDEAPFGLDEYDAWCTAAGLELRERFATWSAEPFVDEGGGYAVSIHQPATRS